MSNRRQQSLKEAFGAQTSATVENDVSSDPELQLSGADSDTSDPDVDHTLTLEAPESEVADESQPSGTLLSADEEMEIDHELLDKPHQPRSGVFPKRQFGQKKTEYRSFKPNWFNNKLWSSWLHWEQKNNRAYCFICRNVYVLRQLTLSKNRERCWY